MKNTCMYRTIAGENPRAVAGAGAGTRPCGDHHDHDEFMHLWTAPPEYLKRVRHLRRTGWRETVQSQSSNVRLSDATARRSRMPPRKPPRRLLLAVRLRLGGPGVRLLPCGVRCARRPMRPRRRRRRALTHRRALQRARARALELVALCGPSRQQLLDAVGRRRPALGIALAARPLVLRVGITAVAVGSGAVRSSELPPAQEGCGERRHGLGGWGGSRARRANAVPIAATPHAGSTVAACPHTSLAHSRHDAAAAVKLRSHRRRHLRRCPPRRLLCGRLCQRYAGGVRCGSKRLSDSGRGGDGGAS